MKRNPPSSAPEMLIAIAPAWDTTVGQPAVEEEEGGEEEQQIDCTNTLISSTSTSTLASTSISIEKRQKARQFDQTGLVD